MNRTSTVYADAATILLVFFLFTAPSIYAQQQSGTELLRLGVQAMHDEQPAKAELYFRALIKKDSSRPDAYLDLGLAEVRQGKLSEAAGSFKTALQLDSKLPGANMFLGITYYQMNHQEDAISALQREIDLDPKNVTALMWQGIIYLNAGNPEAAVAPLDQAARLDPTNVDVLDYRGHAHSLVSQDSYSAMTRLDPNSWHVHKVQAEIYVSEERYADAVTEYQKAISLEPRNSDLYDALGNTYRKTSQLDLAEKTYRQEMNLNPNNPIAMYNVGSIAIERGQPQQGIALLQKVTKIYANSALPYYYLGRGLSQLGRNQEAVGNFNRVLAENPSLDLEQHTYYELSRLYRKLQRTDDAKAALAQYLKLKGQSDKADALQVQDWRKLDAVSPASDVKR